MGVLCDLYLNQTLQISPLIMVNYGDSFEIQNECLIDTGAMLQ